MFIQVYRKGTKRKVNTFNNIHRIVILNTGLMIYPVDGKNVGYDLSLFDFYILQ